MEEAEKMTALKKAYAEIILNTAKEAAARVMVSEKRAQQCNYDLSHTKEEALRLLVRLKQTMELKINEVEIKSVNQQRRIDELEAQLQEAEDIVTNLRDELNEAHTKLEEMAQTQLCNQSNVMGDAPFDNGHPQVDNRLSESVLGSQANWISSGAANGHLVANGHSIAHNYVKEHGYSGEPDLPSVIMRSKQSELYRNGCTQRIRACEANILNGQFLLAGLDNLKTEKALRVDEKREKVCITSPVGADISLNKEEKVVDTKEVDKSGLKMNALTSCRKNRKRDPRFRRCMSSPFTAVPHVVREAQPDLSDLQTSLPGSHGIDSTDDEGNGTQSHVSFTTPSNISNTVALPTCYKLSDPCINDGNEDTVELSSLVLIGQQNESEDGLDAPCSRIELEMKNTSLANLDVKQVETSDGLPSPQPKHRILKYTFQRKRKKESVINDIGSLLDHENLRNAMAKKQKGNLEPSIPV